MTVTLMGWLTAAVVLGSDAKGANHDGCASCPLHQEHSSHAQTGAAPEETHGAAVDRRGDTGMGFSHEKTIHSFGLTRTGGFISAEAKDASDVASHDAIREHFEHIAQAFSSGDFALPMFIHARRPPGVATMKKLRKAIEYRVENTDRGGRMVIQTSNPKALKAVHRFLRFQIEDHRTGDSLIVSGP